MPPSKYDLIVEQDCTPRASLRSGKASRVTVDNRMGPKMTTKSFQLRQLEKKSFRVAQRSDPLNECSMTHQQLQDPAIFEEQETVSGTGPFFKIEE